MASSEHTDSVVEIQLTKGYVTVVDAIDADLAILPEFFHWRINENGRNVYVQLYFKKRYQSFMHRIVLSRKLGRELVRGEVVDHIDGNGLNNRRDNLRAATHQENMRNARLRKTNTSGYKGVCWNKVVKKWQARIWIGGRRTSLGYFDDPAEAYEVYCAAAREHYQDFAKLD